MQEYWYLELKGVTFFHLFFKEHLRGTYVCYIFATTLTMYVNSDKTRVVHCTFKTAFPRRKSGWLFNWSCVFRKVFFLSYNNDIRKSFLRGPKSAFWGLLDNHNRHSHSVSNNGTGKYVDLLGDCKRPQQRTQIFRVQSLSIESSCCWSYHRADNRTIICGISLERDSRKASYALHCYSPYGLLHLLYSFITKHFISSDGKIP